jgi:hypothetical protein
MKNLWESLRDALTIIKFNSLTIHSSHVVFGFFPSYRFSPSRLTRPCDALPPSDSTSLQHGISRCARLSLRSSASQFPHRLPSSPRCIPPSPPLLSGAASHRWSMPALEASRALPSLSGHGTPSRHRSIELHRATSSDSPLAAFHSSSTALLFQ